jgi:hypothetical protein
VVILAGNELAIHRGTPSLNRSSLKYINGA